MSNTNHTTLAAALAAAQGELTNPVKSHEASVRKSQEKGGGHSHSYRYATLPEILDIVRPVLSKHGLAIVQITEIVDGKLALVTRLLFGETSLEGRYPLPSGLGPQEMGSAITYARRYALCALLGIAADDDDDGKAAQDAGNEEGKLRDELIERMGAANLGNAQVCAWAKAEKLTTLAKTVEALSLDAVSTILARWSEVIAKPEAPREERKADPAPAAPSVDVTGMVEPLAALMARDGISKDQLASYIVAKGFMTAKVKPEDYPDDLQRDLARSWDKALPKIKAHDLPK